MKHSSILLILPFFFLPLFSWANNPLEEKAIIETDSVDHADTNKIIEQFSEENTIKFYQDILEKTNSQLSLWWNPYGLIIGLLGVLFTVLTIIAAFLIYRQSKEHKELIQESILKYKTVIDTMIEERSRQLKNLEKNLEISITEYKTKLATENNKQEIQKFIQILEKHKESIDSQINQNIVVPEYVESYSDGNTESLSNRKLHKCSFCGFGYYILNDQFGLDIARVSFGSGYKTIKCPKCGNIETYQQW